MCNLFAFLAVETVRPFQVVVGRSNQCSAPTAHPFLALIADPPPGAPRSHTVEATFAEKVVEVPFLARTASEPVIALEEASAGGLVRSEIVSAFQACMAGVEAREGFRTRTVLKSVVVNAEVQEVRSVVFVDVGHSQTFFKGGTALFYKKKLCCISVRQPTFARIF